MLHLVLIAVHAISAVAAFVLGFAVVWSLPARMNPGFRAYLVAMSLMLLFLVMAIATDWSQLDTLKKAIFAGLLVLGAYTGLRALQAAHKLRATLDPPGYIADVGFTLIALFDGFVIVTAFDLGSPIWLVVIVGALGIILGVAGIHRLRRRAVNHTQVLAH